MFSFTLEAHVGVEPTNDGFADHGNNPSANGPYGRGGENRTLTKRFRVSLANLYTTPHYTKQDV